MAKRVKPGSPKVAVAYIRVSKDEQKLGPEAQRASIEAWAAREGVCVASWHVDAGVSGAARLADRPGLLAAIAAVAEHGAGMLVVAKRDRVARDVEIAATIGRIATTRGARLVSADGTANGDGTAEAFMRHVINAAAEYERGLIRDRTCAALAAKRAKGEKTGGSVPYGYKADTGRLVPVAEEQAVIAAARELSVGRSLRGVAAALTARGLLSRTGRPFAAMQIQRMLAA